MDPLVLSLLLLIAFSSCLGQNSSIVLKTSFTRGTLISTSPLITTTIDIETPSIILEPETKQEEEVAVVKTTNTLPADKTDWSTVLPTRWYPRRKQASSAEKTAYSTKFVIPAVAIIIGGVLVAL